MLLSSHTKQAPWTIIRSDNKKQARLNVIRSILTRVDYPKKSDEVSNFNSEVVVDGADEIILMEKNFHTHLY
jgi:hypothetical protein